MAGSNFDNVSPEYNLLYSYLGRFYVRSKSTHKSSPDYCALGFYYMGRFYVSTLTLRKIFPCIATKNWAFIILCAVKCPHD